MLRHSLHRSLGLFCGAAAFVGQLAAVEHTVTITDYTGGAGVTEGQVDDADQAWSDANGSWTLAARIRIDSTQIPEDTIDQLEFSVFWSGVAYDRTGNPANANLKQTFEAAFTNSTVVGPNEDIYDDPTTAADDLDLVAEDSNIDPGGVLPASGSLFVSHDLQSGVGVSQDSYTLYVWVRGIDDNWAEGTQTISMHVNGDFTTDGNDLQIPLRDNEPSATLNYRDNPIETTSNSDDRADDAATRVIKDEVGYVAVEWSFNPAEGTLLDLSRSGTASYGADADYTISSLVPAGSPGEVSLGSVDPTTGAFTAETDTDALGTSFTLRVDSDEPDFTGLAITAIPDNLIEPKETVTLTASASSATVQIVDNEPLLTLVTDPESDNKPVDAVEGSTDGSVSMLLDWTDSPSTYAQFPLTLGGTAMFYNTSADPLDVRDYDLRYELFNEDGSSFDSGTIITSNATINIGDSNTDARSVTRIEFTIAQRDDQFSEGKETVEFNVPRNKAFALPFYDDEFTGEGSDTVKILVEGPSRIQENGGVDGIMRISRTNSVGTMMVRIATGGDAASGGDAELYLRDGTQPPQDLVTIPDGSSSVQLLIRPIGDDIDENGQDYIVTLQPSSNYDLDTENSATIVIQNDDSRATVTPIKDSVEEGGYLEYKISFDGSQAKSVEVQLLGTAIPHPAGGNDYEIFVQDAVYGVDTGIWRIIWDEPWAEFSHSFEVVTPGGKDNSIRIRCYSIEITKNYPSSNEDPDWTYSPPVIIKDGEAGEYQEYNDPEGQETIDLTIIESDDFIRPNEVSTTRIKDDDLFVDIELGQHAGEAGINGYFLVTTNGPLERDLTVPYEVLSTSTATPGNEDEADADYQRLSGALTIPAGSTEARIVVTPFADETDEDDETVVVRLGSSG
ncbi:MAG: Calx-beta domain-containing protein, partial [Planctomycetota bacterium]